MPSKTISLRIEAYERLKRARRYPSESFSQVVLRASWPNEGITGAQLLRQYEENGASYSEEALTRIEQAKADDLPPEDKWHGS
ncbi:MAG: hypothetical protein GEU79_09985 [Acidimicrobiia bacterium]|nr:hypothetical protein [Acidimicrobiia bacterium]